MEATRASDLMTFLGSLRAPDLLAVLGDPILVLDSQTRVCFVNAQAERLLGHRQQELVGQPLESLLHESDLIALTGLELALHSDIERDVSMLLRQGDDGCIQATVTISRRAAASDAPAFYILTCRDIGSFQELLSESSRVAAREAERADCEARARDAAEQRERLQIEEGQARKLEAIGQLAAGVAHEINTPIQFMTDNLHFLRTSAGDLLQFAAICKQGIASGASRPAEETLEEIGRALDAIELDYLAEELPAAFEQTLDGSAHVAKIVRAMKDFAHPSNGQRTLVDLRQAIETTITLARNTWKPVAEVHVDVDPDLPLCECIADELTQVLLNMVVNACHAIEERREAPDAPAGRIGITARAGADHVEIQIDDNGNGIAKENLERVFDPFFTTKGVGRGTGQGLALAYTTVVKRHAGDLRVESTPGEGTTFLIRLPLDAPSTPSEGTQVAG